MADTTPSLPAGFTLDSAPTQPATPLSTVPNLPAGFTLDAPEQTYDPTDGMSTSDKFVAGVGKSFVDTGRGIYQLGASLGHAMGVVSDDKMAQIQQQIDENKKLDAPLMDTGAGMAGNIAGSAAQMAALPELAPEKFAASPIVGNALVGGAIAGAQPVATGESRATSAGLGAAGGALGGAVSKFVAPGAASDAVQTLKDAGVPLNLAQQTGSKTAQRFADAVDDNPLIGKSALPAKTAQGFTRAVLKLLGTDSEAADQTTMAQTKARIGGVMDDIASRNSVKYDDELQSKLATVAADASDVLGDDQMGVINKHLNNILNKVGDDGTISGPAFQQIRTALGNLSNNQDGGVKYAAKQITGALNDALTRSVSPEDAHALATARTQYQWLKHIEPAIGEDGNISPSKLYNSIDSKRNAGQSIYGNGDQRLLTLAAAGKKVIGAHTPNSGSIGRLAGMAALGAGSEAVEGNVDAEHLAKGAAMGVAAPLAIRAVIDNPGLVNNAAVRGARSGIASAARAGSGVAPLNDKRSDQ
jgi:hypothetical protein